MSLQIDHSETEKKPMFGKIRDAVLGVPQSKTTVTQKVTLAPAEKPHQKVFRLIRDRDYVQAAKLVRRLADANDIDGLLVYGSGQQARRAQIHYDESVANSKRGAFTAIETLTPELAQVLLRNNDGNRNLRPIDLAKRIQDVADGNWVLNGEGLVVSTIGLLNDGQHRLWAVVLTGRPVKIPVFWGAARDTIVTLGSGAGRKPDERFHFAGVKNSSRASAIVGVTLKLLNGRQPTETEKLNFYRDHPDTFQNAIKWCSGLPKGAPISAFGAAAFILVERYGAPSSKVEKFFLSLRKGDGHQSKSPSLALRESLIAKTLTGGQESLACTTIDLYGRQTRGMKMRGAISKISELPEAI